MTGRGVLRFLFILYCVEAGIFLVLAPWSWNWDRAWMHLPWTWIGLHPMTRSAVTAFGAVHILWGAHDLAAWLASRRGG